MGRQLSAADSVRNVGISGAEALQGHVDLMIADNDRLPDQPQQTPEITPDGKINPRAKDYEAVTWEESFENYVKRHKPPMTPPSGRFPMGWCLAPPCRNRTRS